MKISITLFAFLALLPQVNALTTIDAIEPVTYDKVVQPVQESPCTPGDERIVFTAPPTHCMGSSDPAVNCFDDVETFVDGRVKLRDYKSPGRRNLRGDVQEPQAQQEENQDERELWMSCPLCMQTYNNNGFTCFVLCGVMCAPVRRAQELFLASLDTKETTSFTSFDYVKVDTTSSAFYDLLAIEQVMELGGDGLSTREWADNNAWSDAVMDIAAKTRSRSLYGIEFKVQVCHDPSV
uniref:Niemann-Pick C1 N-terminal domain-containing protein n=1 Tax=Amphora coffeiformis TaxID=265554 RepID=A0A7S3LHD2_9STRA|mmetsp:Transcript_6206/g.12418  ORF Transcript_6206/g.12418 Transcript_6206/m.12418 type:complete len:237 (-) Transcript_6206:175-885(-)